MDSASLQRVVLALLLVGVPFALPAQTPQGTAITYQGELRQNGTPVTASTDMVFELFDAAAGGNLVGPALNFTAANGNPVQVQNGAFTTALDFGPSAFNTAITDERYLKLTINGTPLVPRTKIENAPYALQARTAEVAYNVSNTSVGAAQIVSSQVQQRVTGTCTVGSSIQSIAQNGTVTCQSGGNGTVTSVGAGTGLSGGPITGTGTLSIANGGVGLAQIDSAQVQARVGGTCPLGEYVRGINANGSVACAAVPGTVPKITPVDAAGTDLGQYAAIALGGDNLPVLSYFDNTAGNYDLKLAHCTNDACTTSTNRAVDTPGQAGYYTSIAIGADHLPVVSYYESGVFHLKVAHCADFACTAATTIVVDTVNAAWTAIAVGADGLPIVGYYDANNANLKVAHCSDIACAASTITVVDSPGNVGNYVSIAIGADGLPVLSYYDGDVNANLKIAHCGNVACTNPGTILTTIDSGGDVGYYSDIAIGSDGLPVISYADTTNGDLKVAHCANAACTAPGTTVTPVDTVGFVGYSTSIAIGADGLPVVSYHDITNLDLKVAHCGNVACSGAATISTVDTGGSIGEYSSIAIGPDSLPVIAYYDATNLRPRVAKCNNRFCQ